MSLNINKRVFGTPILPAVSASLAARQAEDGDPIDFGESIGTYGAPGSPTSEMITGQIPNQTAKSADTPFVRMWTSIKVIEPEVVAANLKSLGGDDATIIIEGSKKSAAAEIEEAVKKIKEVHQNQFATQHPKSCVITVYDKKKNETTICIKPHYDREQTDYVRKIYQVGNHTYQEKYGQVDLNESLYNLTTDPTLDDMKVIQGSQALLPQQLKNNPLLKPQAAITSISSETQGALGVIKKTVVNFIVHNFEDYDKVYNKFFLKPGATIWVDYGSSNLGGKASEGLYSPKELLENHGNNTDKYFYNNRVGQDPGWVTARNGEVDVISGIVSDYNAKIIKNGSVECSVTLTSANTAMLGFTTDRSIVTRVKEILMKGVLFLGLFNQVATRVGHFSDWEDDSDKDLAQLLATPDFNSSTNDLAIYSKNLTSLAKITLSGRGTPSDTAIRSGVYIADGGENIYITWGLFEDLIINSQFGFGKNEKALKSGGSNQIQLLSDHSFTLWSNRLEEKQVTLGVFPGATTPTFVYPQWWGEQDIGSPEYNADGSIKRKIGHGSYSWQREIYPEDFYPGLTPSKLLNFNTSTTHTSTGTKAHAEYDKKYRGTRAINAKLPGVASQGKMDYWMYTFTGRIPIREVFIHVDVIMDAFEKEESVQKVLDEICKNINDDSGNLFEWKIVKGENDNKLMCVDTNYVEYESYRKNHTAANEDLFTFDVMSENSQVKDFDLEFKLPDDNIGNMYAIQGMSHGNSLFSLSKDIQNAASIAGVDLDSLSILYEPDLGTYRLEQSLNENKDAQAFQVFNEMADFLYTPAGAKFSTANDEPPNLLKADLYKPEAVEEELVDAIPGQVSKADMIKRNDNIMLNSGYQVAKTAKEYFDTKIGAHVVITEVPSLLPYTLNLTIYGISSIIPGDIFRVNYLPKMYQENTYAQTMKVSHDIGSGGWYTTLETQFRLNSELREKQANLNPNSEVYISAAGLQTLQLSSQQCRISLATDTQIKKSGISSKSGGYMNFQKFTAFMTRCNIYRNIDTAVDFMVFFTASQDIYHIFGPNGFTISPTYGWMVKFGSYYTGKWVSKTKIDGTLNWGWEDANTQSQATALFKSYDMDGGKYSDSFQNNNKGYFEKETGTSGGWRYGGWSVLDGGTSIPTQIGIRPPTCKIVAGERYRMLVRGDKWFVIPVGNNTKGMGENSIWSKETTAYKGVLKFWEDYGGYIPKNRRDALKHKTSTAIRKPIYEGPGYEK